MIWSLWRLIYDLEFWIMIGTGNDIVICKSQRPEYSHIVDELLSQKVDPDFIPSRVVARLKEETKLPFYKSRTFWRLILLNLKKFVRLK